MPEPTLRVLVPGSLCDARLFDGLRAHWPSDTPVAVADLHTLQDPERWWPAQLTDLPAQVDVVGFSLGAVLALRLLVLAPQRVRRLALVGCNPAAGSALHRERVAAQRETWLREGPRAVAQAMTREASPSAAADAPWRETVQQMAFDTPLHAFEAQGELNASRPDGRAALSAWWGPLLLASGEHDPWCGDDKQALLREVRPDAQWLRLPGAGHYLPLERPRELADALDRFFTTDSFPGKDIP